jgi:hypothetical protein
MSARLGIVSLVVLGIAACSSPDWVGDVPPQAGGAKAGTTSNDAANAGGDETCVPEGGTVDKPGIDVDPSTLAGCCQEYGGNAHCVPEDKISSSTRSSLATCSGGGLCVPDSLIAGKQPASCDSGFGDGVCISLCVKAVAAQKEVLKQSTCGTNEVCAPCIHPIEGTPTGVCDIGKPKSPTTSAAPCKPKTAPSGEPAPSTSPSPGSTPTAPSGGATSCCGGKGACVPESAVSEEQREKLEQKECSDAQLCAPKENIDKNFVPKSCTGTSLTGEYDGVCLSNCIVFDFLEKTISSRGSCDADHRCIPCKTPFGTETGAPGCE